MAYRAKPLLSGAEFARQVERLLAPVFAECFTKETRKVRDLLLISSFVLILFVLGVAQLEPTGKALKIPLIGSVIITKGVRWVLAALSAYFLLSLIARSYIEWNLWRLKQQSSILKLSNLQLVQLTAPLAEYYSRINTSFLSSFKLSEELSLLNKDPPSVAQLVEERNQLIQRCQQLTDKLHNHSKATGQTDIALQNEIQTMSEKVNAVEDKIAKEKADREKQVAPERAKLQRQLKDMQDKHEKQISAPVPKEIQGKLYLLGTLDPAQTTLRIRFFFEMAFPMLFGGSAILFSFVAP